MRDVLFKAYPWFDHPEGMKFSEVTRNAERSVGHWLFLPGALSVFHRLQAIDEIWAIHSGRLLLHMIDPSTSEHRTVRLGVNVQSGERPVAMVPAGHWQAAELPDAESFAFGSNICAPGFSYAALELARGGELARTYPQHAAVCARLTQA